MAIRVVLTAAATPQNQMRSRFMNFGEDVYRKVSELCTIDMDEVDSATDSFVLSDIRRRDIGTVVQLVNRAIRHNNLLDDVLLVRLDKQDADAEP